MKLKIAVLSVLCSALIDGSAFAGGKTYQITGTIAEVTPTKLVVEKGTERWEIDLGPETKGSGDLKVGTTVTVNYTMSATKIEGASILEPILPKTESSVAPSP